MPKQTKTEEALSKFETSLARHKLSMTAIVHYAGVIRRGLEANDLLAPLRGAASPGGLKIARAAVMRWAKFTKNAALAKQVQAIANPPRPRARAPRLTIAERSKLMPHVEAIEIPARKGILLLVIWSGLRVGEIFEVDRETLKAWRGFRTKLAGKTGALRGADLLIHIRGWSTVAQAISSEGYYAAYAILRRTLARVCRAAGLPYIQPEEFRRLALAEAARTGDRNRDRGRKA